MSEAASPYLCRDDKRIVTHVYELLQDKQEKKRNYLHLFSFLVFVILYLTTLYLQLNTFHTFLVNSSFNNLLPQVGNKTY